MTRSGIARTALIAIAVGIALGVTMRVFRHAGQPVPKIASLGVPWLGIAFAIGAWARDRRRAALVAGATLVIGVGVYYLLEWGVEGRASWLYAGAMFVGWSAGAAVAGAAFGWLGAVWRGSRRPALAAAAISGAFAGEALLLHFAWHSEAAQTVVLCELALGAALPFALARGRALLPALALTLTVALAVAGLEAGVREAMHSVGWAGG